MRQFFAFAFAVRIIPITPTPRVDVGVGDVLLAEEHSVAMSALERIEAWFVFDIRCKRLILRELMLHPTGSASKTYSLDNQRLRWQGQAFGEASFLRLDSGML
jgi:hypothetical protein